MQRRNFMIRSLSATTAALALGALAPAQSALAADAGWPTTEPIRLIVPFPPGGTADVVNRLFAQQLGKVLGASVIVENKAGAGGSLGTRFVADAKPDGYTLLGATSSTHGTNPAVYTKLPYDAVKDFTPITQVITVPGVLSVHPSVKAANLKELIALAKAQPGHLSYASSGAGGLGHLAMELFKAKAGVQIMHVPYRGAGPAFTDLIGGQVSMLWEPLPASLPHIKSGKIRPLAVATAQRSSEGCPMCRPLPSPACPATPCRPGTACWRPRACPRTSATSCTRPACRPWPIRSCASAWQSWAARWWPIRRSSSAR